MQPMTDEPEVEIISAPQPKSFLSVLAEQQNGTVVNEMSKELHGLIDAIERHFENYRGKVSGSIALNMKFTLENGLYKVETSYSSSRPKAPAAGTIMWLDRDGNLDTKNPRQLTMGFAATPIKR